jgi:hypothetical protein
VDFGSNKTHANNEKIPKWLLEQAVSDPNQTAFAGWGSEFRSDRIVHLPFILHYPRVEINKITPNTIGYKQYQSSSTNIDY